MAEHAPAAPRDPRDYRCSDADREMVAQVLHRSAEEGRLQLDEVSQRLATVYAAKTYRDLEAVVADLPPAAVPPHLRPPPPASRPAGSPGAGGHPEGPGHGGPGGLGDSGGSAGQGDRGGSGGSHHHPSAPPPPLPQGPTSAGSGYGPGSGPGAEIAHVSGMSRVLAPTAAVPDTATSSLAVFGEAKRVGVWTVPESYSAVAVFGSVKLDVREAWLQSAQPRVQASAVLGEVEIIVPDDIRVVCDGVGILGEFDGSQEHAPGQPTLRVSGVAILGQVSVKRKPRRGSR